MHKTINIIYEVLVMIKLTLYLLIGKSEAAFKMKMHACDNLAPALHIFDFTNG